MALATTRKLAVIYQGRSYAKTDKEARMLL